MCKFIIACLISLSALSFSSCTQKKVATSVAYMDFPQTIELKARVQPLDTALFRYPFRVRVQGDKAVVMDLHGTDYFAMFSTIRVSAIWLRSASGARLPKRCFLLKISDGMVNLCGDLMLVSPY